MPSAEDVAKRLQLVRDRCRQAADRSGRSIDNITLLCVSKTWPAEVVQYAIDAGQIEFGENKVQEGQEKVPALASNLDWHLIGHLQRNKVRKALPLFSTLHGIDSLKLANAVDRVAGELSLRPKILFEVNVGDEESKFGFSPDGLRESFSDLLKLQHVEIRGLMCIPPAVAKPDLARPYFQRLVSLRDELAQAHAVALPELSMGMSGDFEVAIEEGSTMVRVGSSIFGPRNYPPAQ